MLFYVQQTEFDKASSSRLAILDLASLDESLEVESLVNRNNQGANSNGQASMFLLKYSAQGHGLKEGSWYNLDPKLFDGMEYQSIRPSDSGGAFLRGMLTAGNAPLNQELAPPQKAELRAAFAPNLANVAENEGAITLSVVNCGHGNWNEVLTDDLRLIYDAGASRYYTSNDIDDLVRSRNIASEVRPVVVFISHWDIDHYHALLAFNQDELANIDAIYAPSQLPDTATFKRVQALLDNSNVDFTALEPAPAPTGQRTISLSQILSQGPFRIFRATPGRSRNQTGIVLGVEGPDKVALLTGDHHYEKILQAAKAYYAGKPCVLVTPHHGGHAGVPDANDWRAFFPSLQTPVSCGPNSYDHPYQDVLNQLTLMQGGTDPWRTDNGVTNIWTTNL